MKFDLVEYNLEEDTCRFRITGRERKRKPKGNKTFTALDLTPLSADLVGARLCLEHFIEHLEQIDLLPTRIMVGKDPQLKTLVEEYLSTMSGLKGEYNNDSFVEDLLIENPEDYEGNEANILVTMVPK